MTNLTEKWKKGELQGGYYYIQYTQDSYTTIGIAFNLGKEFELFENEEVDEVLAEVPSFDEWKQKDEAMTTLLAKYGKVSRELQYEKEKHMTRPSLRSPADEVVVEKQVLESTLNRSMAQKEENTKLKELLKECKRQFEEVELYRCDVADTDQEDWFKISTNQANVANKMIAKINQVLGEE